MVCLSLRCRSVAFRVCVCVCQSLRRSLAFRALAQSRDLLGVLRTKMENLVPVQVGVADVESEGPSRAAGGGLVDRLPVRGAFVAFLCVCTSVPALSWVRSRKIHRETRRRSD